MDATTRLRARTRHRGRDRAVAAAGLRRLCRDTRVLTTMRLHSTLLAGAVFVVLAGATTLALASRRITAESAAYSAPSAGPCTPSTLNGSAVLPATNLAVSPLPDSYDASPNTQISLLGTPASALSGVRVSASQTGPHGGRLLAYSQGDGASFVPSKPFRAGETVTVRGDVRVGDRPRARSRTGLWSRTEVPVDYAASVTRDYGETQHFRTRPELEAPVIDRDRSHVADRPGRPVRRALLRPRPERADDLRRIRQPRVVRPAADGNRSHQPAGAAVSRPAGADLVAGPHSTAGLRPG